MSYHFVVDITARYKESITLHITYIPLRYLVVGIVLETEMGETLPTGIQYVGIITKLVLFQI